MSHRVSCQAHRLPAYLWAALTLSVLSLMVLSGRSASIAQAAPTGTVCGQITTNTTWIAANNPYTVTCDVQVMSGVTLTIQSGVIVKFTAGTSLQVDGTLIARGATFTSANAPPAQGDWGHIYFTPTSADGRYDTHGNYLGGSIIQDSLIEWGGGAANVSGVIETNIASPLIDHNTVRNSSVYAYGIHAIARSTNKPIVISRNNISINGAGIHVSTATVISNTVTNNRYTGVLATDSIIAGNSISANTNRGIDVTGSTVTGNTISSNRGGDGGGVLATSSTISDNTITGNAAGNCGGILAGGNSTVTGNTVRSNTSGDGGGMCIDSGIASGNTFENNTSSRTGGGIKANNATVSDNVVRNNNAVDGAGIYSDNANLARNTITGNHASGKGGGIYAYSSTTATDNQIKGNVAAEGGGVYAINWVGLSPNLTGNTIQNNAANSGGGITAINATVRGNTVMSNTVQSDGGGLYAEGGTVTQNKVASNTTTSFGHGAGAYLKNVADFSHNSVISNTAPSGTAGGVSIEGQPQILYNNLYGNRPYDAEVVSTEDVTATLNYWGALICTAIPGRIYDGNDAPPRGVLRYAPSLYSPAPLTQLSSPTNLSLTSSTSTVTLTWSAVSAVPNVGCRNPGQSAPAWGYRVYYDTDSCPPYQGTGLPQGNSPVNAGQNATFILNGLPGGEYHFVVAAYDYLGRESTYSNEVVGPGVQRKVYLPVILKNR